MRLVTPTVFQLEQSKGANGYLVDTGPGAVVIDPGLKSGLPAVLAELRSRSADHLPITHILLTHHDPDHSQSAAELSRQLSVPVVIHEKDAAIVRGELRPSTLLRRTIRRLATVEVPDVLIELRPGTESFGEIQVIEAPGHTPGHTAYQHDRTLFIGDAANVTRSGELKRFTRALISDVTVADRSQAMLERHINANRVVRVLSGHSAPAVRRP